MDVPAGTTLAVLGANGSGKSSFIKALLGVLSPLSGEVIWPHQKSHAIAYLAQRTEFDQLFPLRVRDLIAWVSGEALAFGVGVVGRTAMSCWMLLRESIYKAF
jgi:zinc/manganese transport system ATP-binding protein